MFAKLLSSLRAVLPSQVRKKLARGALHLLYPRERFPSMEATLDILSRQGFFGKVAIDVGAFDGRWTRMYKSIFPQSAVLMVEAQMSMALHLEEVVKQFSDVAFASEVLGSETGRAVNFTEMGMGSSVYEELSPYRRRQVERQLITLEDLIDSHPRFKNIDFLKLDVQGYELEVLRGAIPVLSSVQFILLEVSIIPMNKGVPTLFEVFSLMNDHGFVLMDICDQTRRKDNLLLQADLLFVNKESKFVPDPGLSRENWG